jgi:hypothetical protein
MAYPSASPHPFTFTTEVSAIPDTLPYKWKEDAVHAAAHRLRIPPFRAIRVYV